MKKMDLLVDEAGTVWQAIEFADTVMDLWDHTDESVDEDEFFGKIFDNMKKNIKIVVRDSFSSVCLFAPWSDGGKIEETRAITDDDIKDFEALLDQC